MLYDNKSLLNSFSNTNKKRTLSNENKDSYLNDTVDDRSKRIEELYKNITVVSNTNSGIKKKPTGSQKSLSETRDGSKSNYLDHNNMSK